MGVEDVVANLVSVEANIVKNLEDSCINLQNNLNFVDGELKKTITQNKTAADTKDQELKNTIDQNKTAADTKDQELANLIAEVNKLTNAVKLGLDVEKRAVNNLTPFDEVMTHPIRKGYQASMSKILEYIQNVAPDADSSLYARIKGLVDFGFDDFVGSGLGSIEGKADFGRRPYVLFNEILESNLPGPTSGLPGRGNEGKKVLELQPNHGYNLWYFPYLVGKSGQVVGVYDNNMEVYGSISGWTGNMTNSGYTVYYEDMFNTLNTNTDVSPVNLKFIDAYRGDGLTTTFADGPFDIINLTFVFPRLIFAGYTEAEIITFLNACYDNLNSGGRLVLGDWYNHNYNADHITKQSSEYTWNDYGNRATLALRDLGSGPVPCMNKTEALDSLGNIVWTSPGEIPGTGFNLANRYMDMHILTDDDKQVIDEYGLATPAQKVAAFLSYPANDVVPDFASHYPSDELFNGDTSKEGVQRFINYGLNNGRIADGVIEYYLDKTQWIGNYDPAKKYVSGGDNGFSHVYDRSISSVDAISFKSIYMIKATKP